MFREVQQYTHDTKSWNVRSFETKDEFIDFVKPLFKEPGLYDFDECSLVFNEQARFFDTHDKNYTFAPEGTADFVTYWNKEKDRCRNGAIFKNKDKTWYIPRDYYMWINFLPLNDKESLRYGFPKVRDVQYHIALYEELAYLHGEHVAILKKRQVASSYYHMGKIINQYYFEEGAICKIGASLKTYIGKDGSWSYLVEYRDFLNEYTAWYRPSNPDKEFNWIQQVDRKINGRNLKKGLKSKILGYTLDKNPTGAVGGPTKIFFHEEAGVAPKMDKTVEAMLPALGSGMEATGMFILAGSVGELDQCEPLKEYILKPKSGKIYAVETNLLDDKGSIGMCGLFIPEQWGMLPAVDKYGNSQVEEAIKLIDAERIEWKKDLAPNLLQFRISQKPKNIAEAFAARESSIFALHLIQEQIRRIEDKEYFIEYVDLKRNSENKIEFHKTKRFPITEFPISKTTIDKRGVSVIYERPKENLEIGQYYASIDPVKVGRTTSTDSLASIIIYKRTHDIEYHKENGEIEHRIERGKIVATWAGRYDDLNETHEHLLLMIEAYKAFTVVENNANQFTLWMIGKKKQKYLVPRQQIVFLKELEANKAAYQQYGWLNTGTLFTRGLLPYAVSFVTEELDHQTNNDGDITHITYGVERIPDIMLLKEMLAYREKLNVDRLISFSALAAFAKIQEANLGYKRTKEKEKFEKPKKMTNFLMNPYTNIGKNKGMSRGRKRNAFKNLR